jgi:hypothetical protein
VPKDHKGLAWCVFRRDEMQEHRESLWESNAAFALVSVHGGRRKGGKLVRQRHRFAGTSFSC